MLLLLLLTACSNAPYRPQAVDDETLLSRSVTQQADNISVSAFAPGAIETEQIFGAPLYERGIQPVWLQIRNDSPTPLRFAPYSVDAEYFPPLEVADIQRKRFSKQGWKDMQEYLYYRSLPRRIDVGQTVSGYIFPTLVEGTTAFNVELFRVSQAPEAEQFTFFLEVDGFKPDHADVDFHSLYTEDVITDVDIDGLRRLLTEMPCCSTNRDGSGNGKPVNIVLVGKGRTLLQALLRAHWSETQYDKDENYLAAADYLYGRPPDAIFRKKRGRATDRSELNIWLAPIRSNGQPVWLAQFKHAIGRRFEIEEVFLGTQMDPDVDDGRNYLLQDLWYSQALSWLGLSFSGTPVTRDNPRYNFRNNPYFTDGYRHVMGLSDTPVSIDSTELLFWDDATPTGADE